MTAYSPTDVQDRGVVMTYRVEQLSPLALRDLTQQWDSLCASPGFAGDRIVGLRYDTTKYALQVEFG